MKIINIKAWDKEIALTTQTNSKLVFDLQDKQYECFSPLLFQERLQVQEELSSGIYKIGILADSISGAYGKEYFDNYFMNEKGLMPSILDRLSFIGNRGLGALEFEPCDTLLYSDIDRVFSLSDFKKQSLDVYNTDTDNTNKELARLIAKSNSGAGGAKAKAVVEYNPSTKMIHLSQTDSIVSDGYIKCIVKFNNATTQSAKERFNDELKLEYIYYLLASEVGVNISNSWLEKDEDNNYYFITQRFDIDEDAKRLHFHSLAGLLSHDASSFSMGYESLFRVGNMLSVSQDDKEQMFRTMAFNIVFANRDDHSRNFSFLMDSDCDWSYAPSYDLTYSASNYGIAWHQLSIGKMPTTKVNELAIKKIAKLCTVKEPIQIISSMIEAKNRSLRALCSKYNILELCESIFNDTKEIDKRFYKEEL